MPGDTINLIDLGSAFPLRDRRPSEQTLAKLLGHRLHVRGVQAQFLSDLPVGEVQPHQVEAQNPHAERLMVPGQHRASQVVKTAMARLAQVALPMPLPFVMAVADHHSTVAVRTAHAIRPTMLTHQIKAPGLVQQAREIDHVGYGHAYAASSDQLDHVLPIRSDTWPWRYPSGATTPEPNKSQTNYEFSHRLPMRKLGWTEPMARCPPLWRFQIGGRLTRSRS